MQRSLTILLVCITAAVPTHTLGSEQPPVHETTKRSGSSAASFQFSGTGSVVEPPDPLFQTSVGSTFALVAPPSSRLRDLAPETDGPRIKGLVAKTNWLKGRFVTETEIAHSYGGTDWLENRMAGDNRVNPSKQMVRLGISGSTGPVTYGVTYRRAGQAFLGGGDQASREMWGQWKSNRITVRSTVGQLWNNVAEDASRPRLMQTYGRMTVGLAAASWPEVSLTYARNSFSSMFEPLGITPQRMHSHTLEGAVAYQSLRWNVRLTSMYAVNSDVLRGGAESNVRMQFVSASFRPMNTFTISPMVGYREEIQDASGTRIDGPSASLALQYQGSRRLLLSATANYASSRSNDRLVDSEHVGGKGILAWDIERSSMWTTLIAIEAGYNRASNRVTPSADTEDISGLVRVVFADL